MRGFFTRKISLCLVMAVIAVLIWPSKILGFEAYQVRINAVLRPQDQISPPPQQQCETVVLEGNMNIASMTFRNKSVILKTGSVLVPKLSNINLYVGCDFIIERGASIDVNNAQDGFIRLIIGQNLILNGKILAKSNGTPSSVRISTGADALINGEIDSSGSASAGMIRIDSNRKLVINSQSIRANSLDGTAGEIRLNVLDDLEINGKLEAKGININASGGSIRAVVEGKVAIAGVIDVSGNQKGGSIRISAEKNINLENSGQINFSSQNGNGGIVIINTGKDLEIKGSLIGDGLRSGGSFIATIDKDSLITGIITANAFDPSSGEGGVIGLNASNGNLIISGKLEAKGKTKNGSINLTYCSKNFSGAQFNPLPSEVDNCPNIQSLTTENSLYTPIQTNTFFMSQIDSPLLNYFNIFIKK